MRATTRPTARKRRMRSAALSRRPRRCSRSRESGIRSKRSRQRRSTPQRRSLPKPRTRGTGIPAARSQSSDSTSRRIPGGRSQCRNAQERGSRCPLRKQAPGPEPTRFTARASGSIAQIRSKDSTSVAAGRKRSEASTRNSTRGAKASRSFRRGFMESDYAASGRRWLRGKGSRRGTALRQRTASHSLLPATLEKEAGSHGPTLKKASRLLWPFEPKPNDFRFSLNAARQRVTKSLRMIGGSISSLGGTRNVVASSAEGRWDRGRCPSVGGGSTKGARSATL